ncbi:MAG: SRPBCC family protein [Rhodospirillaceae bacterium]
MRRIDSTIDIAAPPAAVWSVLVDFAAYPDWNPFIRRLQGEARVGARLEVTVQPPGGGAMTFRPMVRAAEPNRELRWLGRVLVPGLFDGEHGFRLEAIPSGCRFHHGETFGGLLVPLFGGMLTRTEQGFVAMNEALKRRVES